MFVRTGDQARSDSRNRIRFMRCVFRTNVTADSATPGERDR